MKEAIRENFDGSVSAYDAYEAETGQFGTLATRLSRTLRTHHEGPIRRLLDAGAGSGSSAAALEGISDAVVALDLSRSMLARNPCPQRVQGDFDSLPLRCGTFDAVAFTASLFLTPAPETAVAEANRVRTSDGVVGAVAPEGWYIGGADVFERVGRESRSPAPTSAVIAAFEETFDTVSGVWRFEVTAEQIRRFHSIPAVGARLYPRLPPEERATRVGELFADIEGTGEQRWRWLIGR